ncbi:MAG: LysR substrate-binding domain-containing protein [Nevskiales bacterium]|nr:LysR substrate-binding domain-containing protein [Nevskiales bacterium]
MRFLTGLRAFHYTARCGGTTAAAQAMGVSQPTVSAHIGALETRYGVQLFAQVGRRLVLTEFGESILVLTNRLFELEEEARELMTDAQGVQRGHLRISAVGPYNVMRMLATFRKAYPRIFVTLSVGDSSQIVERVLNYQADVGVLVHDVRDERVHSIPFRRQRLVVFAPRNHPLAQRTALTLADLDGVEMVVRENGSTTRKVFEQALAEAGVRVRTTMEIGSRESIREAVACGLGLGVVSDIAYVPDPRLRQLPISDLNVHSYAHVICLRERLKSRLVAAFIDQLDAVRAGLAEAAAESDPVIA